MLQSFMDAAKDIAEMYYKSRLPKFIKKKRMDNEYRKLQEIVDNYFKLQHKDEFREWVSILEEKNLKSYGICNRITNNYVQFQFNMRYDDVDYNVIVYATKRFIAGYEFTFYIVSLKTMDTNISFNCKSRDIININSDKPHQIMSVREKLSMLARNEFGIHIYSDMKQYIDTYINDLKKSV